MVLRWHAPCNRHARILATSLLLLLEVLVIGHLLLLLVGHVAWVHTRAGHAGLRRIDVTVSDILRGIGWDIRSINTILASGRIGSVQASLN